jgi:hypothetical protein
MNNKIVEDLFSADKAERRRILYEEMYRIKWESLRKAEREDRRETRNLQRTPSFVAAKD